MDIQRQDNQDLQKVADLVEEIRFAMLTTEEDDGSLRSRPMATMQMDNDGCLWFFTALSSGKVDEMQHHRQVNLVYARTDKQDYLSISGSAQVVRDQDKMRALWSPWIEPWFPKGLGDPNLGLLKVTIAEAEYWDAPGSTAKRVAGLAKSMLTGKNDGLGENRKLRV